MHLRLLPNELQLDELGLDQIARLGAQKLLKKALKEEVESYLNKNDQLDPEGKRLVVKNGSSKERTILTGAGEIKVQAPRVHDKREGEKFTSSILPPYMRKTPNLESVIPVLYLKGLSANSFTDALSDLFGDQVKGLSKSTIHSLKKSWEKDLEQWKSEMITDQFVYLWADGVHVKVRLGEDKKLCLLVIIGVTANGDKRLLSVSSGYRESEQSWTSVFNDLEKRGLNRPLCLIGDGALGLWAAANKIEFLKDCKEQRCWVHKISNVLNKLPKRVQPRAKELLHEMMMASTEDHSLDARDTFIKEFNPKYPKSVECIKKDWNQLTTHFSFPAEHWQHIRTTNPIESMFATVKLRSKTTKGAGSTRQAETMAFKLMREAEKTWRKIRGYKELKNLLDGAVYKNGEIAESAGHQSETA